MSALLNEFSPHPNPDAAVVAFQCVQEEDLPPLVVSEAGLSAFLVGVLLGGDQFIARDTAARDSPFIKQANREVADGPIAYRLLVYIPAPRFRALSVLAIGKALLRLKESAMLESSNAIVNHSNFQHPQLPAWAEARVNHTSAASLHPFYTYLESAGQQIGMPDLSATQNDEGVTERAA
jgi:hypothetical protein